ncbi:unnamed protein product [Lactuca saligna]|uniref:Uncharacterized protein n=1 Tax=Lactuca saligna TaxID=75948 RepID=A0AA36E4D5_LACSI|nr:unnamed protein product [Lactuca saligna]
MGYEGTFPPTIKKLLPPCWKYLAHVFVSCVFGRRSGANEISLANTGAIAALAAGFEFNFSKFIMHELVLNLEGSKRDKFLMYPRFLQIIFNVMHPEPRRGNEALDLKSNVIDQNQESSPSPWNLKTLFIQLLSQKIEEVHDSPSAAVAEEHDHQKENETLSAQEGDDDDRYDDIEFLKEIDFTGISDDIPTNIEFDLDDEEFGLFLGIPSSCPNKVNEVSSSATKTREEGNVLKIFLFTSKALEVASSQGEVTSEISPFVSSISTSAPIVSDSTQPQTSQSSMETSQSFASLEVPTVGSAPQVLSTITTTTAYSSSKLSDEVPSTMFETGGSSSIPEYSPTRPSLDEAYISYFNLNNIMYDAFGEKVKAVFQQPHGINDPPTAHSQSVSDDLPVDLPAPRTTTIVNRFEKESEGRRA